jgi:hypothetical protein
MHEYVTQYVDMLWHVVMFCNSSVYIVNFWRMPWHCLRLWLPASRLGTMAVPSQVGQRMNGCRCYSDITIPYEYNT